MALEQVFLYVTQACNIRCTTCYALEQLERAPDLAFEDLVKILELQRALGAWKLSFLGGEPTVYRRLPEVAVAAREMGYRFLRITTNGMFKTGLLNHPGLAAIDVWAFSLDGATAAVNDEIRKGGRFDRIVANMRAAVERGLEVRVNVTVTSRNIDQVFDILALVEQLGGREVNLNVMFLMGDALAHADLAVTPARWLALRDEIGRRHREFSIRIKLPPGFAKAAELADHRAAGHRCLAADGTRTYVASNGDVYPCLTMMDDPARRTASFADGTLRAASAFVPGDDSVHDYCRFIHMRTDGLQPLCIFHKQRLNQSKTAGPI